MAKLRADKKNFKRAFKKHIHACDNWHSGSDNSKIQEVGRGLRLPVNESLSRISDEQFYLNYIVDFTEKNFAEKYPDIDPAIADAGPRQLVEPAGVAV